MRTSLLFLFLLLLKISVRAQAPYTINNNTVKCCGGDDMGMGSSFKAVYSGQLDSIDVFLRSGSSSTATFYLYDGNGTSTQIHQQTLTSIPIGTQEVYRIRLSHQVLLNQNQTYTFMVYGVPLRYGTSDTYPDGSLWTGTSTEFATQDLDFIAYVGLQTTPYVISNTFVGCCGGDDLGMGTSFLTSYAGQLDSIDVYVRNIATAGTIYLYDGNGTNTLLQQQSLSNFPQASDELLRIRLSSPLLLSENHTYTFMVYGVALRYGTSNTYAGGSLWTGTNFEHPGQDLDFSVYVGSPTVTTNTQIQTNSTISFYQDLSGNITVNTAALDELILMDLSGRILKRTTHTSLSTEGIQTGLYLVSARNGNQTKTTKIILQ